MEALRELLGAGFTVKYKLYLSKNFFTGQDFVSNKKNSHNLVIKKAKTLSASAIINTLLLYHKGDRE